NLLVRSRLLPANEVQALYQRWRKESKGAAAGSSQFTKWLAANKHLTGYQASLLERGATDGFFCNHYKILDRIGHGCMAGVYKAAHDLGYVVALKVLPPSKAKQANVLGRFQREARLAIRLNHPNVVRAFQLGKSGDLHYL